MRLSRFLAVPLFLSIAVAARADDPKTYDFAVEPVYKVGETKTSTSHDEDVRDQTIVLADGTAQPAQNEKTIVDFTATHKIIEIDAKGHIAKELIHFSAWKHAKGDEMTSELTGAHLMVTGKGPMRSWKLMTPDLTPSDPAKEWLDKRYGSDDKGDFEAMVKPSKPVTIGESWNLDIAKLSASLGKQLVLDTAKSSAKATLDKVDGDLATIRLQMKLQVGSIATPGMTLKVLEGGVLEISGEGFAPLSADARGDGGSSKTKLDMKVELPQGATMKLTTESSQQSTSKTGGEMPEIPAAKEAPAVK